MRNFFTLGGVASSDFETYIATSNAFESAKRIVSKVHVPGRNGDLTTSNDDFENFQARVMVYVPKDMQKNVPGLAAMLLSDAGYRRYEETMRPEYFRMARYDGGVEIDVSDHRIAGITLNFDCKPQRWLISGEIVMEYTENGIIANPTFYSAKPLLRVYGVGIVTIGGASVEITQADEYTDIDCEIKEAYKDTGANNCNGNVVVETWPTLPSGESAIELGYGITKVEITPRWWTV